jgi:hypothetical protein
MNSVQSALNSPRLGRYLLWVGVVVLAAGVVAVIVAFAGGKSDNTPLNPDKGFKPTLPAKSQPLKNSDGITIKTFSQLDDQTRSTIRTFINTAVARQHVEDSWTIVSPSMRAGYTLKQWKSADDLPIIPYPGVDTKHVEYFLDYASNREILVEVGLAGKRGVSTRPVTFMLGLRPDGKGSNARWLVSYWMPRWTPPVPQNQ